MDFFLLYMVYHVQQRDFQQLIMTQTMLIGTQTSKAVMRMPVENKTKPLITTTRQFIRNHGSFNYAFFSTLCVILQFVRGDPGPLDLQMRSVSLVSHVFQF